MCLSRRGLRRHADVARTYLPRQFRLWLALGNSNDLRFPLYTEHGVRPGPFLLVRRLGRNGLHRPRTSSVTMIWNTTRDIIHDVKLASHTRHPPIEGIYFIALSTLQCGCA